MNRPVRLVLLLSTLVLWPSLAAADHGPDSEVTRRGGWTFQSYATTTLSDDPGELHQLRLGVGRYLTDTLSLSAELVVGSFDAEVFEGVAGGDGTVFGVDALLRWRFAEGERWELALVGGLGVVRFDSPFPAVASRTNFEDQVGLELAWYLNEQLRLLLGVRYLHVSNAGLFGGGRNPGYDAFVPQLGLAWSY
ncbi:MAG: acyloxyacyl hydrolase [Acidobacteriota bacterium]